MVGPHLRLRIINELEATLNGYEGWAGRNVNSFARWMARPRGFDINLKLAIELG